MNFQKINWFVILKMWKLLEIIFSKNQKLFIKTIIRIKKNNIIDVL